MYGVLKVIVATWLGERLLASSERDLSDADRAKFVKDVGRPLTDDELVVELERQMQSLLKGPMKRFRVSVIRG